jgi:hypothetical protein
MLGLVASCFDAGVRWEPVDEPSAPPTCAVGALRCGSALERCAASPSGAAWETVDDCAQRGMVCVPGLQRCAACQPGTVACEDQTVVACSADGDTREVRHTCDPAAGEVCRGGTCANPCQRAASERSNVGCEYWAVDLDNAMIDPTSNASAQQFAVVVSNPQTDVAAYVRVYQDDGQPGDDPAPLMIADATIAPRALQVFKLGPREVDGSPPGEFNTGTHTALTRHAYKLVSSFPTVAYQFNPLENANVFSNDASLLKPRESFDSPKSDKLTATYVVAGWPQTIAITDDPSTNFNPSAPINLRAFLTIVGTREGTQVRVTTRAAVVAGGPVAATAKGGTIEATLGAFDVLNLETGDFGADFTGSIIHSNGPVAVFSGSEASDAPRFATLSDRRCCADHLEEQLDPLRTAGKRFVLAHTPSRTAAVRAAGADIGVTAEPEYFRFVNASNDVATVTTTLAPPDRTFTLSGLGDFREVTATTSFMASSTGPIHVGQVMASQDAVNVKRGLPGGDPSLVVVPPIEQYRADYVFLTPDKYAFDFISVVVPPDVTVLLDDAPLGPERCTVLPGDGLTKDERGTPVPPFFVYQCQLSYPTIDPLKAAPDNVRPGAQNDGVHRLVASAPIGVIVSGFDNYVSYAYAAGTELREIAAPQ